VNLALTSFGLAWSKAVTFATSNARRQRRLEKLLSWKNYMRRQTNTVNFSGDLPLAQGIQFGE
jgi:hypothetical protein